MKIPSALEGAVAVSALAALANANPISFEGASDVSLVPRAFPNSPSGGYAPGNVTCPKVNTLIRPAQNISSGESDFIRKRHAKTDQALKTLLSGLGMEGFDVDGFIQSYSPTVALAFSGGGYRAMLSGAGAWKALDSRTPGSTGAGQLGGLLQGSTYVSGLSGGSWLVGSVIVNNYTTIEDLQTRDDLWDLEHSIFAPEGALRIVSNAQYWSDLQTEVKSKEAAGFDTSLTDYWGRALSRQFVAGLNGGPAVTWSSIALTEDYKNADFPFPIVLADGRNPGELLISSNTTVYEFNPLEFGSFDPQLYTFTPLEYIGTFTTNGKPDSNVCTRGFDNAGFIMGTSSSLFNQAMFYLDGTPKVLQDIGNAVLSGLSEADADIADYFPNPFYGVNPNTFPSAKTRDLTLVDGGEDLQNIPLHPLIQPVRNVDVIFAFDNSADTLDAKGEATNWPNGTAMVATYERSLIPKIANGTAFPSVPGQNTFINLGLNNRPTFFGCDAKNFSSSATAIPPLIVYMPNSPWTFASNVSTFNMKYSDFERDNIIGNGWNIATQGNSSDWGVCVGCAIVHRETERRGTETEQCKQCMRQYCWDGTLSPDVTYYNPTFKGEEIKAEGAAPKMGASMWGLGLVAAVTVAVGLI